MYLFHDIVLSYFQYFYYYYLCPYCGNHVHGYEYCYDWTDGCGKKLASSYTDSFKYWHEVISTTPYSQAKNYQNTGKYYITENGEKLFKRDKSAQTGYRYSERTEIATYYFYKTNNLESNYKPEGENISAIQEWVTYQVK